VKKWVELKMKDVDEVQIRKHGDFVLNTGSPHFISLVEDVLSTDVVKNGKAIRYNKEFEAQGINVNFVQAIDADSIMVRTYERGVEDETLSCGTGVTASALVFAHNEKGFNRKNVKTLGGFLAVEFEKINDSSFQNIWLCELQLLFLKGKLMCKIYTPFVLC
jgi:diaminopimelate epimerase